MNDEQLKYFLVKYRAYTEEDLADVALRISDLAQEAAVALRQVIHERGLSLLTSQTDLDAEKKKLSNSERGEQTKLSSELWKSDLSRKIKFQFSLLAMTFAFSALGPQGLKLGMLWILSVAGALCYLANKWGQSFTRSICADEEKTIDEKSKALRRTSYALWPALLIAAFLGVVIASTLRGV